MSGNPYCLSYHSFISSLRKIGISTTLTDYSVLGVVTISLPFALRIANVLNVEVSDICSDSALQAEDWSDESRITLPELPHGFDKVLDENRIKTYLKNSLYPLMEMFGKNNLPKLDEHLTNYYQLTDEGRRDVDQFINAQLQIKKDPKRAKDVKTIKKW